MAAAPNLLKRSPFRDCDHRTRTPRPRDAGSPPPPMLKVCFWDDVVQQRDACDQTGTTVLVQRGCGCARNGVVTSCRATPTPGLW
jgi:hypothetical protein